MSRAGAIAAVVFAAVTAVPQWDGRGETGETLPVDDPVTTTLALDVTTTTIAPTSTTTPATPASPLATVPLRTSDVRVLTRIPVRERVVFITIDDGGYISDSLVDFLNRERIPVTSFVMPEPLMWQLR
ncbi:MAG: hypothetical protein ACKOFT_06215, partial [Actinomycetota bacterium]